MNIRIVKLDLEPIRLELARIADALEGLRESTNPEWVAQASDFPGEKDVVRTFYSNEEEEIIQQKLDKIGRKRVQR